MGTCISLIAEEAIGKTVIWLIIFFRIHESCSEYDTTGAVLTNRLPDEDIARDDILSLQSRASSLLSLNAKMPQDVIQETQEEELPV